MNAFEERMLMARVKSLEEQNETQAKQINWLGEMMFAVVEVLA
ncbi:MAG: hypothetical protein NWE90_07380 [Candidatus Bathyarchaeota archaeon]|nr:hypothetical protein [Candidatus Bathyarchaeota archaeon]